jgi:hypothetical protein
MQVGDLVKVNMKRRGDVLGLVLKVVSDECNCVMIVQPMNPANYGLPSGFQVYANPVDVEVVSEGR